MFKFLETVMKGLILFCLLAMVGLLIYDFNGASKAFIEILHPPIIYLFLAPAALILSASIVFGIAYGFAWCFLSVILTIFHVVFKKK
jgi:hypothetical protein